MFTTRFAACVLECLHYEGFYDRYLLALTVPMPNGQLNTTCFFVAALLYALAELEHKPMVEQGLARVTMHCRPLETLLASRIGRIYQGDLNVRIYRVPTGTLQILTANDWK